VHAVHLPPRQLWRAPALAALIALAITLVLLVAAQTLNDGSAGATRADASAQPAPAAQAPERTPAWARDPLSPPTSTLAGAR